MKFPERISPKPPRWRIKGPRIEIPALRNPRTIAATSLWLAFALGFAIFFALEQSWLPEEVDPLSVLFASVAVLFVAAFVLSGVLAALWTLTGVERIRIDGGVLVVRFQALGFASTRRIELDRVTGTRVRALTSGGGAAVSSPGSSSAGTIEVQLGKRTRRFGLDLDEAEARQVLTELRARAPALRREATRRHEPRRRPTAGRMRRWRGDGSRLMLPFPRSRQRLASLALLIPFLFVAFGLRLAHYLMEHPSSVSGWLGALALVLAVTVVLLRIAWHLTGKEVVELTATDLILRRQSLGEGRARAYDLTHVRSLRASPVELSRWSGGDRDSLGFDGGTVAFDYGAGTVRFGAGVDPSEAEQVVEHLLSLRPELAR